MIPTYRADPRASARNNDGLAVQAGRVEHGHLLLGGRRSREQARSGKGEANS